MLAITEMENHNNERLNASVVPSPTLWKRNIAKNSLTPSPPNVTGAMEITVMIGTNKKK